MLVARAMLGAGALGISVLCSAVFASQAKPPANVSALVKAETRLNERCRGGSGDDPATMKACDEREKYVRKLKSLGWCYGRPDQIDADRTWQKCVHSSAGK